VYEFIICTVFFGILWRMRKRISITGKLFMLYLMLAGLERFAIEFLRLNPRILFGLSEAQLISLGLMVVGVVGWFRLSRPSPSSDT
jgi:phosphatidylglycerol:prolipoprotein diacylglycerol transferase